MRILVTNDDGIHSVGLRVLARTLVQRGHEVFVVAPSSEHSGAGAAIGPIHLQNPAPTWIHDWPELRDGEVVALEGPPALCTYGGCLGAFGPKPDLVVSGVNPGYNTGQQVIHSGTVGAAMTAAACGVSAIAVSIGWHENPEWETAADIAANAIPALAARRGEPVVFNINVPNVPRDALRGIRDATLGRDGEAWVVTAAHIDERLVMDFMLNERDELDPHSDVALLEAGYAAITVLTGVASDPHAEVAQLIESAGHA